MTTERRSVDSSDEMRMFVAVAVQPLLAGVLGFVGYPILLVGRTDGVTADPIRAACGLAIEVAIVALLVTLLCALPTAVWLLRRRAVTLSEALLFGFAFGNLPLVIATLLGGSYNADGFIRDAVYSSLLGVAGSALFWRMAIRSLTVRRLAARRP